MHLRILSSTISSRLVVHEPLILMVRSYRLIPATLCSAEVLHHLPDEGTEWVVYWAQHAQYTSLGQQLCHLLDAVSQVVVLHVSIAAQGSVFSKGGRGFSPWSSWISLAWGSFWWWLGWCLSKVKSNPPWPTSSLNSLDRLTASFTVGTDFSSPHRRLS